MTTYGIILNDHTDPYITCRTTELLDWLVQCHWRWTNPSDTLTTVVLNPDCEWCEDELDGWYEVDEMLDFTEPALHDHCRGAYAEQQAAMHYV